MITQRPDSADLNLRRPARPVDRIRATIVSCFGLGYAPIVPGTFGTLGGVALVIALERWACPRFDWHFGLAAAISSVVILLVGISLGGWAERWYRVKDPGPFVIDEVLGYLVSVLRIKDGGPGWNEMLLAFVSFRVLDVMKPWPARQLESLPKGWGIMLDDFVSALYSLLVVSIVREWCKWP